MACDDLSILCVTRAELCVQPLLRELLKDAYRLGAQCVLAADGRDAITALSYPFAPADVPHGLIRVESKGYIESVLDEAVAACSGEHIKYVLRIDDDESISPAMMRWLQSGAYHAAEHWCFPRQHLWPTSHGDGVLMTPHLYPDLQTRLSTRAKSGGRHGVHAPSPHGGGEIAPVALIHHKYTVRTPAERLRIAQVYDAYSRGYGTGNMKPFSLPEESYETMEVVEGGDGTVPWEPTWRTTIVNGDHGF